MKLKEIKTARFGPLGDSVFRLDGKNAVIFGRNEKGKTSFIDAVTTGIYGRPKGNTSFGKEFLVRYAYEAQSSAIITDRRGTETACTPEKPLSGDDSPEELFKALLVVRAGECQITNSDKHFSELFTNKVLGGGKVDLREAMKSVKRVYAADERYSWWRLWLDEKDKVEQTSILAQKAADMEGTAQAKLKISEDIQTCATGILALENKKRALETERAAVKLQALKRLQAQMHDLKHNIDDLAALNRSTLLQLTVLQKELAALEKKQAEKTALKTELTAAEKENSSSIEEMDKRLLSLSGPDKRPVLKQSVILLLQKEEIYKTLSGKKSRFGTPLAWISAVIVAAAVMAFAFVSKWDYGISSGVALALGALAYGIAFKLDPTGPVSADAEKEMRAATEKYLEILAAMGPDWQDKTPQQVLERLSADENESLQIKERRDIAEKLLLRAKSRREDEEAEIDHIEKKSAAISAQIQADLIQYRVKDINEFSAKLERLEFLNRSMDDIKIQIVREADISMGNLEVELEERILELTREIPQEYMADAEPRTVREIETDISRTEIEIKRFTVSREHLHKELNDQTEKLSLLEGELKMTATEVFLSGRLQESRVKELALWRQAAEETYQIFAEISKANDEMMKNCVENAGPVFSRMSGGKYEGLKLIKSSPFEAGSITVRHSGLGEKPLEWLSTGTKDALWLSVRIAFAVSGYKEPSFMILDEPFITMDEERTTNALKALLNGDLKSWQFVILTKNEETAALCAKAGFTRHNL